MSSLTNWEIKRPKAKNMPWSSRRKMKWETNPPRLMNTGTSETHARKCPNWSPLWYRTCVNVTAFSADVAMADPQRQRLIQLKEIRGLTRVFASECEGN